MPRIGPTQGVPTKLPTVLLTGVGSLVDDDDLDTYTVRAEALRLGLDPGRLVEELEAGRRTRGDELRSVLQLGADDADLDAVDREHLRGRHPRRAPCRSPSRRCSSPGTGSSPAPAASAAARRRSRTRGCRTTWRRGPTRSRRRSSACPRAGPSSAATRRRCRPPPAGGPASGSAAKSSSNIVARKAPPPTFCASPSESVFASVVCSSWPWKSLSPMIESGLYALPPLTTSSRTRPWLCCGSGIPSMNASVGARSIVRAETSPLRDPLATGEERRAHVDVRRRGPGRRARSRAGRRTADGATSVPGVAASNWYGG